ncbi:hypothetical protein HML84_21680 [Alcanivorax sp. IO_7]|nr:hypothetical protein HML84_21680 [Alcanivorax sp. IO_7]
MLVFEGTPLSAAVARINDFRPRPVVLLDRARGDAPVEAVLHLDNLDSGVPPGRGPGPARSGSARRDAAVLRRRAGFRKIYALFPLKRHSP